MRNNSRRSKVVSLGAGADVRCAGRPGNAIGSRSLKFQRPPDPSLTRMSRRCHDRAGLKFRQAFVFRLRLLAFPARDAETKNHKDAQFRPPRRQSAGRDSPRSLRAGSEGDPVNPSPPAPRAQSGRPFWLQSRTVQTPEFKGRSLQGGPSFISGWIFSSAQRDDLGVADRARRIFRTVLHEDYDRIGAVFRQFRDRHRSPDRRAGIGAEIAP